MDNFIKSIVTNNSPVSGIVSVVQYENIGFGQRVEILTNINGKPHYVILAHMVKGSPKVKVGQAIEPGDLVGNIGHIGGDGKNSLPTHLHMELRDCSDQAIQDCSVKRDTKEIIVNPEPALNDAQRCRN